MSRRRGVAAYARVAGKISPRFPAKHLAHYPGLVGSDIPIWRRFIDRYAHRYVGFDYGVRVGVGGYLVYEIPENVAGLEYATLAKRIDAVGYTKTDIETIEVKSMPGLDAIGQVISYRELFRYCYQPGKPVRAILVCDYADPDIVYICQQLNVIITEV